MSTQAAEVIGALVKAVGESYDGDADPVSTPNNFARATNAIHAALQALDQAGYAIVPKAPSAEMSQKAAQGVSESFHEDGFDPEHDDPSLWNEFVKAGERALEYGIASGAVRPEPDAK